MPRLLNASLLLCERVLTEAPDGVQSLIRIVDIFLSTAPPQRDDATPVYPVKMVVYCSIKFALDDPEIGSNNELTVFAEDPGGKLTQLFEAGGEIAPPEHAKHPRGITLVANLTTACQITGTHYIVVRWTRGEEICRAPFTVVERTPKASTPQE